MKLIALMMSGLVSSAALAGGGPHEKFPDCKPGEFVETPAPAHLTRQEYIGAVGARLADKLVGVALGVEYVGRTFGKSGNCPSHIVNNGTPRLYVSLDVATQNYQWVRREVASNDQDTLVQVRRDEKNRVRGLIYRNAATRDDFTLFCYLPDYSPAHTRAKGLLIGEVGGVSTYQNVECQTGLFSSIPESTN